MLFFIRIQMVDWSSHLGNIWWRPRCRVQTARVWPLHPPCAKGIAIFAALVSCNVSNSGPVWRDGDYCLSAQLLPELLELTSLAKMKISCHIDRDLFVTSFLGVENCSLGQRCCCSRRFYTRFELHLETPEVMSETNFFVIPSLGHVLKHASDVCCMNAFLHGWKPVSYA